MKMSVYRKDERKIYALCAMANEVMTNEATLIAAGLESFEYHKFFEFSCSMFFDWDSHTVYCSKLKATNSGIREYAALREISTWNCHQASNFIGEYDQDEEDAGNDLTISATKLKKLLRAIVRNEGVKGINFKWKKVTVEHVDFANFTINERLNGYLKNENK